MRFNTSKILVLILLAVVLIMGFVAVSGREIDYNPDVVEPRSIAEMDYLQGNDYQCQLERDLMSPAGEPIYAAQFRCYYRS